MSNNSFIRDCYLNFGIFLSWTTHKYKFWNSNQALNLIRRHNIWWHADDYGYTSELKILISGMINLTKNWSHQKNHYTSIHHCICQCIHHYLPRKATPLAEGESNQHLIRVNFTFQGQELMSNLCKAGNMLHFFPIEWLKFVIPVIRYQVHWDTLNG